MYIRAIIDDTRKSHTLDSIEQEKENVVVLQNERQRERKTSDRQSR